MIGRNFQSGDLVYGRREARIQYNKDGIFNSIFDNFGTIDQYPFNESDAERMGYACDSFPLDHASFTKHLSSIEKYQNINSIEMDRVTGKWKRMSDEEATDTIARKCKRGLEWAKEEEKLVHFILDGIDINGVLNKESKFGQKFTSRELRYLYRNRKNGISDNVNFWRDGRSVNPPWEDKDGAELWKNYVPRSEATSRSAEGGETSSAVSTAARGVKRGAEDDAEHGMLKVIKRITRGSVEEVLL